MSEVTITIEKMAALRKKRDEAEAAIQSEGKVLFAEAAAGIFTKHPDLVYFSWTQYKPHWNDGSECVFRAHTDYLKVLMGDGVSPDPDFEGDDDDDEVSSYELEKRWDGKKYVPVTAEELTPKQLAAGDIFKLLNAFENRDYELLFGDHARVTVKKDGVVVDEYAHD